MIKTHKSYAGSFAVAALMLGLFATGCTKMASESDLRRLDEQIAAANAAEARVADLEAEKARLEAELRNQQQILADHEAEFEEIKRRMGNR